MSRLSWMVLVALSPAVTLAQESRPQQGAKSKAQKQFPAVRLPADWDARDLEGRWFAYRRDRDAHPDDPNRQKGWVELLAERRDFELLEQLCIYEGWATGAGSALVAAEAPQWMRVALWNVKAYDSHNMDNAKKALGAQPARVLGWFHKYPIAQRGKGADHYAELQKLGVEPMDPGNQLPPLDGMQILLPQLDVPGEVEEFGDRTGVEPGRRYVHQVLRALDGLIVWGEVEPMHVHKVLALTSHEHTQVRSAAFSTLTQLPGGLVPHRGLWEIVASDRRAADRQLAAMAFTYGAHPEVFLKMHEVLLQPNHVGWTVMANRLADIGNGFTVQTLQKVDATEAGFHKAVLMGEVRDKINQRINQKSTAQTPEGFRAWLERVAWADHEKHPLAADLRSWTVSAVANVLPGENLAGAVEELLDGYEVPDHIRGEDRTEFDRLLKKLANELNAMARKR